MATIVPAPSPINRNVMAVPTLLPGSDSYLPSRIIAPRKIDCSPWIRLGVISLPRLKTFRGSSPERGNGTEQQSPPGSQNAGTHIKCSFHADSGYGGP